MRHVKLFLYNVHNKGIRTTQMGKWLGKPPGTLPTLLRTNNWTQYLLVPRTFLCTSGPLHRFSTYPTWSAMAVMLGLVCAVCAHFCICLLCGFIAKPSCFRRISWLCKDTNTAEKGSVLGVFSTTCCAYFKGGSLKLNNSASPQGECVP